jgi:hypothetical protein
MPLDHEERKAISGCHGGHSELVELRTTACKGQKTVQSSFASQQYGGEQGVEASARVLRSSTNSLWLRMTPFEFKHMRHCEVQSNLLANALAPLH